MKRQLKRMVPGRPHRPASVRWSTFLGWHRRAWQCGTARVVPDGPAVGRSWEAPSAAGAAVMYAGDEFYGDDVTAGVLVDEPPVGCQVCADCGFACAKTDDGLCWSCSGELGEAGA